MSPLATVLITSCVGGLVIWLAALIPRLLERPRRNKPTDRHELVAWARAARAAHSRRVGTLMIAAGILVWPVGAMVAAVLSFLPGLTLVILAPMVTFAITGVSAAFLRRGGKMRVKAAEQVLDTDPRPPIVYLRPFEFDHASRAATYHDIKTYEVEITRALRSVAPVVAIGDPTEELPELGSVRIYADDAEWERKIEDLTSRGGTIILHVGDSAGLAWEVSHVVGLGQPERIILSAGGALSYADFRRKFGHIFPRGLPRDREGISLFLYFDPDWTPRWLPFGGGRRKSRAFDVPSGSAGEQRAMVLRRLSSVLGSLIQPLHVTSLAMVHTKKRISRR